MVTPEPLFAVTSADVALTSDEWYTPRWLFDALGITFDMDVSAPVDPAFRTCPARQHLTVIDDGLTAPWDGLVWMNPPYSKPGPWVERFAAHRCGLALLPAVKSAWVGPLLGCADALALVTVDFGRAIPAKGSLPCLLILIGCGPVAAEAVGRVAAVDRYAQGAYHVRPPTAA